MRKSTQIVSDPQTASFAEACTPSRFSTRSSVSSTCSSTKYTDMKKNLLSGIMAILLLMTGYAVKASSTITQGFNSSSISAGKKIWFSAVVNVNGSATYPLTIYFNNQVIASPAFSISVPNGELILDPAVVIATTVYNGSTWVTTAPPNETGHYFISGYSDSLHSNISGGLNPVSWTGTFSTCGANVSISWEWAASVYTSFNSDMNNLGIKPSDCNSCSAYSNSDHAGSPEHYLSHVVTGATGSTTGGGGGCGSGSGTSYTGYFSAAQIVALTGTNFFAAVCPGSTANLAASISGGTWSSGNTAIASISAGGVLTGVSAGTAKITYAASGCTISQTVTVNAAPTVSASSASSVCQGSTLTLTGTSGSGTGGGGGCGGGSGSSYAFSWHGPSGYTCGTQNPTRTGVCSSMAGAYSCTVTAPNGCNATATTTVAVTTAPTAGTVSGAAATCVGATTTFTDAAGSGAWTSGTTGIATVNASGVITGVAVGTATISYKVTNSCGNATATKMITVTGLPNAGTLSGATTLCAGATVTVGHSGTGGAWSASPASVATINSAGMVTGVAAGAATISYTVSNGCGTTLATRAITVNAGPNAGTITGTTAVCGGTTINLGDAAAGGVWSTSTGSIATVNGGGVVTGISAGTATISYKVTNGCGTATATKVVTISAAPSAGSVTGTAILCAGATTTLGNAISGGTWSTGASSIATVSAAGVVTGVGAGVATISYAVTNSCGTASATKSITVNAAPGAGAVTGADYICAGLTTNFTDAVSGGAWSTSAAGIATINAAGVVTGVAAGTATISYRVSNSCGNTTATKSITVGVVPNAGAITSSATVCAGSVINLGDAVSGGVWSTSAAVIATVDASGVVTGVAAGTATISYSVTNICGTAIATKMVTVGSIPTVGAVTGSANVCVGATAIVANTVSGGVWSTDVSAIATIDASGVVTGVSAGVANLTYTVANSCGAATANGIISVSALPNAGTISGATLCAGTSAALNNTVSGGAWSTSAASIASIDASGNVTGVSAGIANIAYTVSNSCGATIANSTVNVNALPNAGTITGGTTACMGGIISLGATVSGGVWSVDASSVASIDASGVVTAVSTGTANVAYTVTNSCGSSVANSAIIIGSVPDAGAISGATLCAGTVAVLNSTVSGGAWSTGEASIATVDATGNVTGVADGAATISYTVANSCGNSTATAVINVSPLPAIAAITGNSVCLGSTTTLADAVSGGVWSTSDATTASINAGGTVTGVAVGSATISYTVTNGCGTVTATFPIAVNILPYAGTVTGFDSVCVALTGVLVDGAAGGVWSTGAASMATVDATGVVTGVTPGSVTISYTVNNGCGSATASKLVHVKSLPDPGVITGVSHVAYQSAIVLTDTVSFGTWTASNSYATVSGGVVAGIFPGTVTISYSLANLCGTAMTSTLITVDSPVAYVSNIIGPAYFACVGGTAAFWDITSGGIFAIAPADSAIASVTQGGLVTGITAGTATLSYTYWGATATAVLTVYPLPAAISGPTTVCNGASMILTDATPGGVWTSDIPSTAAISPSGIVTAANAGVVPISYTLVAPAGCRTVLNVTVNVNPAGITGASSVCPGTTTTLYDVTPGGVWSGSNGHATVDAGGNVTGISAGGIVVSYTAANGCPAIDILTVFPVVGPINGNLNVCNGTVAFFSDTSSHPMSWASSTPSVATISASGAVSGLATGTATITFSVTNGCFNTVVATVDPTPAVTGILGASSVSLSGGAITLSDLAGGGIWSSSNPAIMTVGSTSGIVTPVFGGGSSTIYYTVTSQFGCRGQASKLMTSGARYSNPTTTTSTGTTVNVADQVMGGDWSTSDNTVATVDGNGVVTALAPGSTTITHTTTGNDGAVTEAVTEVIVNALPFDVRLFPSPNNGAFSVTGIAGTDKDVAVTIEVTNMLGQVVYTNQSIAPNGMINNQVSIGGNLSTGNYVLIARNGNENKTIHFVIEK